MKEIKTQIRTESGMLIEVEVTSKDHGTITLHGKQGAKTIKAHTWQSKTEGKRVEPILPVSKFGPKFVAQVKAMGLSNDSYYCKDLEWVMTSKIHTDIYKALSIDPRTDAEKAEDAAVLAWSLADAKVEKLRHSCEYPDILYKAEAERKALWAQLKIDYPEAVERIIATRTEQNRSAAAYREANIDKNAIAKALRGED